MSCYRRGSRGGVSNRLSVTGPAQPLVSEQRKRNSGIRHQGTTDPSAPVELIGGQHEDRSDKGKPAERRGRKATGLSPFRDTAAGPPKAPEWVGDRHLRPYGRSATLVRPHLDGEIAVASITFDARGLQATGAPTALPGCPAATVTTGSRPSRYAHTGAVGRSHTTPTPDPDPRDSGLRTVGALRPSELAPRPRATVPPGRAQGLHYPASRTHQSNGARSPMANTPRLGPAYPYSIGAPGRVLN
jgi:hypothetical protein